MGNKRIKNLFDPNELLNPGVIINDDHKAHLKNLKSMPKTNELVEALATTSVFIFVDLYAFVIANLIQTYIAFMGYYKNKKVGGKE